jgi:methylthioribulose-1-phosphate dehydratase
MSALLMADRLEHKYEGEIAALQELGAWCYQRGWSLGTSSNFSLVVDRDPLRLVITASGRDKGRLQPGDFTVVNEQGHSVFPGMPTPSAETLLHVAAVRELGVNAVLHTHSVWSTLLSDLYFASGSVELAGYEMLKGLNGLATHQTSVSVPIFDNTQDMPVLAERLTGHWREGDRGRQWGFLLRGHGLYTWGRTLAEARRHLEVLEFLFEVVGRRASLHCS